MFSLPTKTWVASIVSFSFLNSTLTISPTLAEPWTFVFSFQVIDISLPASSFTFIVLMASSQDVIVPVAHISGFAPLAGVAARAGRASTNAATAARARNFFIHQPPEEVRRVGPGG